MTVLTATDLLCCFPQDDQPGQSANPEVDNKTIEFVDAKVSLELKPDNQGLLTVDFIKSFNGWIAKTFHLGEVDTVWRSEKGSLYGFTSSSQGTCLLRPKTQASYQQLQCLCDALQQHATATHFDQRTDKGCADLYFHYYGMLQHQQNMLQDYIRTGTYYSAIMENAVDFHGKAVMDVGCGSGILSLFAAQAGARVVYAVEASNMAKFAQQLADANPTVGQRVVILHGKVEEVDIPEKVDVLVSEPMGTLLVNERMLESYIYARDKFLKPGGKLYPAHGRIHLAAFSDPILYAEVAAKALFWQQPNFYGVNVTCLEAPAAAGYFSQVVVDQIPPDVLVSNTAVQSFNFSSCTEAALQEVTIPLSLQVGVACAVHGIAAWFDVLFDGTTVQRWLSTAPGLPCTHWFQLRCLLDQPIIFDKPGETITGTLRLVAHNRQSYDVFLTLKAPALDGGQVQERNGRFDLKEPYYRQLVTGSAGWYAGEATTAMGVVGDGGVHGNGGVAV